MSDPDATSRSDPVKGQMCHWLISNVPLRSDSYEVETHLDLNKVGTELAQSSHQPYFTILDYYPPAPPKKTGYHRYVFAVLKSSGDRTRPSRPKERPHWGYGKVGAGIREYAAENELEVVGRHMPRRQTVY